MIDRLPWVLRPMGARLGLILATAVSSTLHAQSLDSLSQAAGTITAAELARHVGVLAHDSMQRHGRAPLSRGVDLMAQYVTGQLGQLGLRPGGTLAGSDTTWIQRYPIDGWKEVQYPGSSINFMGLLSYRSKPVLSESGDVVYKGVNVNFAANAYPVLPVAEVKPLSIVSPPGVILLTGPHTAATVRHDSFRGFNVLYVPPRHTDSATQAAVVRALYETNPGHGVILIADDDSAAFAARREAAQRRPFRLVDDYMQGASATPHGWAVAMRGAAIDEYLRAAVGVDLAEARAVDSPHVRRLSGTVVMLWTASVTDTTRTAPNVIGVLEGRDPELKNQFLLVTAHLDSLTPHAVVDNASGVAGLLTLAKALSEPGARPRRSVAFLATSGAAQQFVGSNFFCGRIWAAAVRCSQVVATVNLDMIGSNAGDSLAIDGADDLELGSAPAWTLAAHPELNLHLVSGAMRYTPESDYFAFVRRGVPSLHFHAGRHDELGAAAEPHSVFDAEYAARVTRLAFYVTHSLAQAESRPRWTAEARRRRLLFLGAES